MNIDIELELKKAIYNMKLNIIFILYSCMSISSGTVVSWIRESEVRCQHFAFAFYGG